MAKIKCLTSGHLNYFANKIISKTVPTETHYRVELTAGQAYTFTVPNYSLTNSLVEVYLNGLRLIPTNEYTLSTAGIITLLQTVTTSNNILHVVHRKWG